MNPTRIQLKRVKGWRMPPDTVRVDRATTWGNPFVIGKLSPDEAELGYRTPPELCGVLVRDSAHAVDLFRKWLFSGSDAALASRISIHVLRGRNLACWCPPGQPCHADVLLEFANRSN
jgi:hypothetical protein